MGKEKGNILIVGIILLGVICIGILGYLLLVFKVFSLGESSSNFCGRIKGVTSVNLCPPNYDCSFDPNDKNLLFAVGKCQKPSTPLTWEECINNPNHIPVMEMIYPPICRLPDGRSVTQPLSGEEKQRLRSYKVSESQAIELVGNQKEVQEWLKLFSDTRQSNPKTVGRAVINFDHLDSNKYVIHVYEDLPDHIATFNWYEVSVDTGEVTRVF